RAPDRLDIRLPPRPDDAVLLHRGVRWNVPGALGLPGAAAEPGNAHAMPAAVVAPSVVPAFEHAVARDPPERERIAAMLAPVKEDGGRTFSAPEHHERTVHERDCQRSTAQLRRPGYRIPPATRKGHGVRPGIHPPMMPFLRRRPERSGIGVLVAAIA